MTLQVIKAEDVRDGERCGLFLTEERAREAMAVLSADPRPLLIHERPIPVDKFPFAIVDRPAPTPTALPALDLDAVEAAERAMTARPWGWIEGRSPTGGDDYEPWVAVGAGAARVAELREGTHVLHPQNVANAAGIVALRNAAPALIAEVRALRAQVGDLFVDPQAAAIVLRRIVDQRAAEIADLRAKLAEAKRLGMEACNSDAETPVLAAIAAALEAL